MKRWIKEGEHVYVADGPHCGARGPIDTVDEKRRRVLIDCGGGRSGGLTWIPFDCLRGYGGEWLEGGMKP